MEYKWEAVYLEKGTYGFERGLCKPAIVIL